MEILIRPLSHIFRRVTRVAHVVELGNGGTTGILCSEIILKEGLQGYG